MSNRNRDPNHGTTEDVPPAGRHVDKMASSAALSLMLDSQAGAIPTLQAALPAIEAAAIAAYDRLSQTSNGRLIYAGAGTSARIGVQDGAELPPTFNWPIDRLGFLIAGGPSALLGAIENAEDDAAAGAAGFTAIDGGAHDVVIGIAASGKTPYTLGAIEAAQPIADRLRPSSFSHSDSDEPIRTQGKPLIAPRSRMRIMRRSR